jgi:2-dehydropantoate 2-reductase
VRAGAPAELGPQDYVFLTVKAQGLSDLAPSLRPLLGPATVVVSGTNGIPWWFFQEFRGPLADCSLRSVDPDGTQAGTFPRERTLGSVVHASARVLAPGRIEVVAADRLILGEPGGGEGGRLRDLVEALRAGGINAEGSKRIRHEVWAKLWGNMSMNPLSALTRSGTSRMLASAELRELCIRMMEEMQACARPLGLEMTLTPAERIAVTQRLGDFRTSMLADLDAGRPLELDPQLGAVVEIAEHLGVPAPFMRSVLGLARLISP